MTKRNQEIGTMRRTGATLRLIAATFGVSGERVRQILVEEGVPTTKGCNKCGTDIALSNKLGRCRSCRYTARTPAERFAAFVPPPDKDGHQLWLGMTNSATGYAVFNWRKGKRNVTAHSAALMLRDGLDEPPPKTPVACHRDLFVCIDRRNCVALSHIVWSTQKENVVGCVAKGMAKRRINGRSKKERDDEVSPLPRVPAA